MSAAQDAGPRPVEELVDERVDDLMTQARRLLYAGSLVEVTAERTRIQELIDQAVALAGYSAVPDDVWDMLRMLDDIIAGKVDRVAALVKHEIPAHRAALVEAFKTQDEQLKLAGDRLERLLQEAVAAQGGQPIIGTFWRARTQGNAQPSVAVEDETKVPATFCRRRFELRFDYPAGNTKLEAAVKKAAETWASDKAVAMGISDCKWTAETIVPAKPITDAWRAADGKLVVPGVRVTLGRHLRIEALKATKLAKPPAPLPFKVPGVEAAREDGAL